MTFFNTRFVSMNQAEINDLTLVIIEKWLDQQDDKERQESPHNGDE